MEPRDVRTSAESAVLHLLQPGERIELGLIAAHAELHVTDRRIVVTEAGAVRLDIPIEALRRIQFDIEAERPAAFVIVPHSPGDHPQVLAIPRDQLHMAAEILAFIGERLS
jgi:hypothetical protein